MFLEEALKSATTWRERARLTSPPVRGALPQQPAQRPPMNASHGSVTSRRGRPLHRHPGRQRDILRVADEAFQSSLNVRGPGCIPAHQTASRPCTSCTTPRAQQRASLALRATYPCPTPTPGSRLSERRAPPRACCARRCATCRARTCASVSTLARSCSRASTSLPTRCRCAAHPRR